MKIFNKSGKVNFVDQNNVIVGYDTNQFCCEDADWYLAESPQSTTETEIIDRDRDFTGYMFDTAYFNADVEDSNLDEGGIVVFKLTRVAHDDIYLHLYNSHNGYYSHGFEFKSGDTAIQDGSI